MIAGKKLIQQSLQRTIVEAEHPVETWGISGRATAYGGGKLSAVTMSHEARARIRVYESLLRKPTLKHFRRAVERHQFAGGKCCFE